MRGRQPAARRPLADAGQWLTWDPCAIEATDQRGEPDERPADIPRRLRRLQAASGLSWTELTRSVGVYRHTGGRWKEGVALPSRQRRGA
jgi:hypothetical protein